MSRDTTKLPKTWPRQPFVGLALATMCGILCADSAPNASRIVLAAIVILALISLVLHSSAATYVFVAASFFFLHSLHLTETPGRRLAQELGDQSQSVTVHGVVVTEPKSSAHEFASFLLKLTALEVAGERRPSGATIFVRWRGTAQFGDELQLFGIAEPISAPRNPGEFDMCSYLARRDVRRQLFVGYEGDGVVLRHRGG